MITRRITTFAFIFAIVALAIGLSSCERVQTMMPDPEMPPMEEETPPMTTDGITIGVALGLTGANAEPYGIPMQEGLELAREEINMTLPPGVGINFITEDALSTVEGAKAAVQTLVDQGVPAIVGIGISTHLKEAFPIANDAGVVAFSPISSATGLSSLGDYIFRTGLTVGVLNSNGTMVTHPKLEYKKVALIYDEADEYSESSNDAFKKTLEELGVEILTVETFQTHDTDFSTQLMNIKGMEPDTLFVSALAAEMTQIITQARDKDTGLPDSVRLVVPDLTVKEIQEVRDDAEGIITFSGWFSMTDTPGNAAFVEKYKAKHGVEPGPWSAQAYATLHILAKAIMTAESPDAMGIRDALAQTMDLPTILGNFSFDPDGEAVYDPIVFVVKDGELQLFE
ncbi:ABC transporter substrate-binding protein [Candidatus Poribacteria bacterium]|nr:ABC transporter substrate-binding protein [Candidatus Poribacteria bacterium]